MPPWRGTECFTMHQIMHGEARRSKVTVHLRRVGGPHVRRRRAVGSDRCPLERPREPTHPHARIPPTVPGRPCPQAPRLVQPRPTIDLRDDRGPAGKGARCAGVRDGVEPAVRVGTTSVTAPSTRGRGSGESPDPPRRGRSGDGQTPGRSALGVRPAVQPQPDTKGGAGPTARLMIRHANASVGEDGTLHRATTAVT